MRISSVVGLRDESGADDWAALSVSGSDREMVKSASARATLETRRRTAEQVVAELTGEEREAEEAVASAREAVSDAVRGVVRTTAAQIANDGRLLNPKRSRCANDLAGLAAQSGRWARLTTLPGARFKRIPRPRSRKQIG